MPSDLQGGLGSGHAVFNLVINKDPGPVLPGARCKGEDLGDLITVGLSPAGHSGPLAQVLMLAAAQTNTRGV